jgi:hypothetical protein
MGRKMIKYAASNLVSEVHDQPDCFKENSMDLPKSDAAMEYLCNLPPHRSHCLLELCMVRFGHCMDANIYNNNKFISGMRLFIQKTFQRSLLDMHF